MKTSETAKLPLNAGCAPFIIAEMSGNHNHSLEKALKIVDAVAGCGVDALKIQTYTADTMTIDSDKEGFVIKDGNSLWDGKKLYDLYKEAYTPWEWHEAIFKRCREHGIIGFSTPFDPTAVDFLRSLDVPLYKIASFEIVDLPLIRKVASCGKPMLISTGMATIDEIRDAVDTAKNGGCEDVVLLKCTSSYPASPENSNLMTIPDMKQKFGCEAGLSDHTLGIGTAIASIALGARVIEKHFTLSRDEGGIDSVFSMEPLEMKRLVDECRRAYQSMGFVKYGPTEDEKMSLIFRRSIYVVKDIKKGEIFTESNIRSIRPGFGISPKHLFAIIGKTASEDIIAGTPLTERLIAEGMY